MTTELVNFVKHNKHVSLLEAERAAKCELLAARDDYAQSQQLEDVIFNAWLSTSKATLRTARREAAAFDAWYAASKALDESGAP